MKYEIKGTPLPVVICELDPEETLITEKGSMSWMSPNMEMQTVGGGVGKALGRMFSGEALFQNKFTARGSKGLIAFASSFPGQIMPLDIQPGKSMIVQKSAFLAAQTGVELSVHFQKKFGAGLFGGEGFIMQKLSGQGVAFVEIDGHVVEYNLQAGQSMMIDTGY
ncbi:MAG: AIM24 family protein, partial [Oscillospiraceae bacterium]|nr:AIM24 family protein [Oscillospiraceae bacterium]